MIATRDMNARVQPHPYSDHMAKILCFHLCQASQRNWKGQRFHEAQKYKQPATTDYAAMRGPTAAARQIRHNMQQTMEQKLQPFVPQIHLGPRSDLTDLPIFVAGSQTGWGIHIATEDLSFYSTTTTDPTQPLWTGATHLSSNTSNPTAIIFALMWVYYHVSNANIWTSHTSTYAAHCTQGYWAPTSNNQLVKTAQHWLRLCQEKFHISFRHTPANNRNHDSWSQHIAKAVDLAKQGAQGRQCTAPWMQQGIVQPPPTTPLPTIPWQHLAKTCQEVTTQCLPQAQPQHRNVPYSKQVLQQLEERRKKLQQLQQQFHAARGTPQEQTLYQQMATYRRATQQWARRQRSIWIREICQQLDTAMRLQDTGRFHKLLKQLGVNISGKSHAQQVPFGLEETIQFVEAVSNEAYTPPDNIDQLLPAQQTIKRDFGNPPTEEEVTQNEGFQRRRRPNNSRLFLSVWPAFFNNVQHE